MNQTMPSPEPSDTPLDTRNLKLVIAYKGTGFHGWQRQDGGTRTVQAAVEDAAGRVLGHPAVVSGASRTDAGVHAAGQVANVRTPNMSIPLGNFRRALSSKLPADVAVVSAEEAPAAFHASRSAIGKTYRYRIHCRPLKPVMFADQVWHYWRELNVEAMLEAAGMVIGEYDFRGFAYAAERRVNTIRTITSCQVTERDGEIHVFVSGNGFLYKMVRNIVGTLVEIGRGRWGPDRVEQVLQTRDRGYAGPTAPPGGLSLISVLYPPQKDGPW